MARYIGYCTYDNEDAVVLSESEYSERGIPEDWAEYVWIESEDKAGAYQRYDECAAEYESDVKAGRLVKKTY
jgi:hypothetical protein